MQSDETRLIKIGKSIDPPRRARNIQSEGGNKLVLLGTTAEHEERSLHAKFKACRVRGEWFKPEASLIEFLRKLGCKPLPPKETKLPFSDDHPFWGASDLFSGEWYDKDDFSELWQRLSEKFKCECEAREEEDNKCAFCSECKDRCDRSECDQCEYGCECDNCFVNRVFENIDVLLELQQVDGVIYSDDEWALCVVFRRDQFGRHADPLRDELMNLRFDLDCVTDLELRWISWTQTGGFKLED